MGGGIGRGNKRARHGYGQHGVGHAELLPARVEEDVVANGHDEQRDGRPRQRQQQQRRLGIIAVNAIVNLVFFIVVATAAAAAARIEVLGRLPVVVEQRVLVQLGAQLGQARREQRQVRRERQQRQRVRQRRRKQENL